MKFQFLHKIVHVRTSLLLTLLPFAAESLIVHNNPPIAKPSCVDRCGDIPIPFPFGTTQECYYAYNFFVTCNRTSIDAPKLFWQNTSIEIKSISLLGQITVMQFVSYDCDNGNDTTYFNNPYLSLAHFFTANNTANKFTTVGCDSYGFVSGQRVGRTFSSGCTASCSSVEDLEEGSCMGKGCCQTWIPKDVWNVSVMVGSYLNYSKVRTISNCSFGFLAEATAFRFYPKNLTNLRDVEKLPLVVDWAMGNVSSCEEARMNSSDYLCRSENSHCYKPENGYGYRCICNDGYHGNPYLTHGCQDIDECNPGRGQNKTCEFHCVNTPGSFYCLCPKGYFGDGLIGGTGCRPNKSVSLKLVAGISVGSVIGAALLLLGAWKANQTIKAIRRYTFYKHNGGLLLEQHLASTGNWNEKIKLFTSKELTQATDHYNENRIIGRGGQGIVYKGMLTDGTIVAVKKSKKVDENEVGAFINEVVILSQINHRNIVNLIGCCLETEVPLLVYEYVSNGTLFHFIQESSKGTIPLTWEMRVRIAAQVAGAIAYLHSASSTPIYHRDIKSTNILLDDKYQAKLSDFGTSRSVAIDQTHLTTRVFGTFGYMDPEYYQSSQFTEKSDVYSFGVVMVELLTGQKVNSTSRAESSGQGLASYFLESMEDDKLFDILDARVRKEGKTKDIVIVAELCRRCLSLNGRERPTMKEVAIELEGTQKGFHDDDDDRENNNGSSQFVDDLSMESYNISLNFSRSNLDTITTDAFREDEIQSVREP